MFQQLVGGIVMGSVYALIALGYDMIFATSGVINFAQGELVMLGALFGLSLLVTLKVPFIGTLILVSLLVGLIGVLLNKTTVAPLGNDPSAIGWIMTTLGAGIVMRNLAMFGWGRDTLAVPPISASNIPFSIAGITLLPQELWIISAAVFMTIAVEYFYGRTLFGKAVRATAHNPNIAKLMGINSQFIIMFCFALSGGMAAIAGLLISPITFASTEMGAIIGLKGFAAAILGGLGNSKGALLGGLLLGVLESLAVAINLVTPGLKDAVAFLILIGILLVKPGGITGAVLETKV